MPGSRIRTSHRRPPSDHSPLGAGHTDEDAGEGTPRGCEPAPPAGVGRKGNSNAIPHLDVPRVGAPLLRVAHGGTPATTLLVGDRDDTGGSRRRSPMGRRRGAHPRGGRRSPAVGRHTEPPRRGTGRRPGPARREGRCVDLGRSRAGRWADVPTAGGPALPRRPGAQARALGPFLRCVRQCQTTSDSGGPQGGGRRGLARGGDSICQLIDSTMSIIQALAGDRPRSTCR